MIENKLYLLKKEMVDICLQAFNSKLFAGTSGNLSFFIRDEKKILITPTSVRYETMSIDDVVVIDIDGNIIDGKHKPSSEWKMHTAIYKDRSDIDAIFHTHSPYATSFATVYKTIPTILIEMIPFLGGDIKVAVYQRPGTKEVGEEALKVLDDRNGCLLGSHGVLTIGKTLEQVYIRAQYVEDAATIYHHALNIGEPVVIA